MNRLIPTPTGSQPAAPADPVAFGSATARARPWLGLTSRLLKVHTARPTKPPLHFKISLRQVIAAFNTNRVDFDHTLAVYHTQHSYQGAQDFKSSLEFQGRQEMGLGPIRIRHNSEALAFQLRFQPGADPEPDPPNRSEIPSKVRLFPSDTKFPISYLL
jgi:hypothetical protein